MGHRSGRATLQDVARAAGVSASAASLALNGRDGVKEETRLRILAAARTVGYRRNASAPVRDRAVIGVIPTDLGNPYHTDVITGIERHADATGVAVVIAHGRRDSAHLERQLQRMLAFGVDAVIVVSTWLPAAALEAVAAVVPVVVIGRMQDPVPGTDSVRSDDEAGAALAVRHLHKLGHRALAQVSLSHRPAQSSRRGGFLAECARLGLRDAAQLIGPENVDVEIDRVLRRVRSGSSSAPTAIFAANDIAAVRVMHRAADLKVSVPGQLSIVGYDSSAVALTIRPHLSSINQPREAMGRLAAKMAQERLDGRTHDSTLVVEPELRERASTAFLSL